MTTPDPGTGTEDLDAFARIKAKLAEYGLASLADWAWSELEQDKGEDTVMLDLTERPEFKAEFPEIEARKAKGLPPVSAAQILEYRARGAELAKAAGLPTTFYDQKSDFTNLIVNNVSFDDFTQRVKDAQVVAYQIPADVRAQFSSVLGIGDFTALAFDPTVAAPILERKIKEAEVLAGAARGGFGLDAAGRAQVTDYLAGQQAGRNVEDLAKGVGELQSSQELFMDISGNNTEGGAIGTQEQLAARFGGNANAQRRIEERAARRKAQFAGASGFGAAREGVGGLGVS